LRRLCSLSASACCLALPPPDMNSRAGHDIRTVSYETKGSRLNRRALLSQKSPCAPPLPRDPASTCIPAPLLPLRLCILSRTPYPQEEQPHRPRYTDNIRSKKRLEPQSTRTAIPKISLRSSAPPRPYPDLHS